MARAVAIPARTRGKLLLSAIPSWRASGADTVAVHVFSNIEANMNGTNFRRANGKIPACEPCKKRKVACDHVRPVCSRCISRKHEHDCVYLGDENTQPQSKRQRRLAPGPSSASSPTEISSPDRLVQTRTRGAAGSPSTGYLGFSSFSAVFQETGILNDDVSDALTPADALQNEARIAPLHPVSPDVHEMCLTLLRRLPDRSRAAYLFRKRAGPLDGWIKYIAKHILQSLYESFGQYLGPSRNASQMDAMAQKLCTNTAAPCSDDEPDAQKWISQFSGQNFRWESIGLLICFWDEDTSASRAEADGWASVDRESLELCVELCRRLSRGNSIMLYLTHCLTIAESLVSGDASTFLASNRSCFVDLRVN